MKAARRRSEDHVNKRTLTNTLKRWTESANRDGTIARTIAALYVYETKIPKKLREPLFRLAMACLACEVADAAPANAPSFPDLYRAREKALEVFADAVASALTKRDPPTTLPCDAEGIMYHDRTREPEEP
jgi:hypothetical protein